MDRPIKDRFFKHGSPKKVSESYYLCNHPDREVFDLEFKFKRRHMLVTARVGVVHEYKTRFIDQKQESRDDFIEYLAEQLTDGNGDDIPKEYGFIPYNNFENGMWWFTKSLTEKELEEKRGIQNDPEC